MDPPSSLLTLRRAITQVSIQRAASRLLAQQSPAISDPSDFRLQILGSQVADDRLPSMCAFHPSEAVIATAGWSGRVATWSLPAAELLHTYEGHSDRVNSVNYTPGGRVISGSADRMVVVWGSEKQELKGHEDRVNDAAGHWVEGVVVSVSHDLTVRVWDATAGKEVLVQRGHGRPVYALAVHPDGSLTITGDLGGVGLVWDLRTGKAIMHLHGHLKQLLALSIAPNGYTVASGSDDNTVRIWDLRRHGLVYTIPAHEKLVAGVWCRNEVVYSASYDGTMKAWKLPECSLLTSVPHSNKVTSVSVSPAGDIVATCCFDKTLKLMTVAQ